MRLGADERVQLMREREHRGDRVLRHRGRVDTAGGRNGDVAPEPRAEHMVRSGAEELHPSHPWRQFDRSRRHPEGEHRVASAGGTYQIGNLIVCTALAVGDLDAGNGAVYECALLRSEADCRDDFHRGFRNHFGMAHSDPSRDSVRHHLMRHN
jgi:hypothetical protein